MKQKPLHFTLFLTRRCNARCQHCFYLSESSGGHDNRPELSRDEIEKVSGSVGNLLWLAFSGGEIFLRDDIDAITRIMYENNRPVIILFSTNGLLPDIIFEKIRNILASCQKSTIIVKLSIDGNEAVHDSIRGVPGGFRKTMETYRLLQALVDDHPHFELGINTVYFSENQHCMKELIGFVNDLPNITTHTVSLIRGNVSDKQLLKIDTEQYQEAIRLLESNLKKKRARMYRFRGSRIKAAQDIIQRRLIHDTLTQQKRIIPCYAGRLNLVMTETGDLYPCESFDLRMGNVREHDHDIKKTLQCPDALRVMSNIQNNGCFCTHECYLMTNIFFNPRMYPAVLKEYLQIP